MSETFVGAALAGNFINLEKAIDDAVDRWHEDPADQRTLREALGFTQQEYSMWVEDPRSLSAILYCRRERMFGGMNAAISGIKGYALVIDGDAIDFISLNGERSKASPEQIWRMLYEPGDTEFVKCLDLADVKRRLRAAADGADALQLTLIALDADLSAGTRKQACDELAKVFADPSVVETVERVLYARALGREHDVENVESLCAVPVVEDFFARLRTSQTTIADIESAWESVPEHLFPDEQKQTIFVRLLHIGVIRNFVNAVASNRNLDSALLVALNDPHVQQISNLPEILTHWLKPLRLNRLPAFAEISNAGGQGEEEQ